MSVDIVHGQIFNILESIGQLKFVVIEGVECYHKNVKDQKEASGEDNKFLEWTHFIDALGLHNIQFFLEKAGKGA